MPYSEVGEVTPSIARGEWNAQFLELYELVEDAEAAGVTYMRRLDADVSNSTGGYADTGLEFPVVSGGKYVVNLRIVWRSPSAGNLRLNPQLQGPADDGAAIGFMYYAESSGWRNVGLNDSSTTFFAGTNFDTHPRVMAGSGLVRANASGTAKLRFKEQSGQTSALVVLAGTSLEVHSV